MRGESHVRFGGAGTGADPGNPGTTPMGRPSSSTRRRQRKHAWHRESRPTVDARTGHPASGHDVPESGVCSHTRCSPFAVPAVTPKASMPG